MIIDKISLPFLSAAVGSSNCTFSDDSRLIYFTCQNLEILIYDTKYNNYIILKPDETIVEYFSEIRGFNGFNLYANKPHIHVVNQNTLILSFDDHSFKYYDNGYSALLVLIRLNFSAKTFSLIDKSLFKHCYYACLLKDGFQYALLYILEADMPMDEGNEYRCMWLEIDENHIILSQKAPIKIDYDFLSLAARPINLYLHDNKIWFCRDIIRNVPRVGQPRPEWKFIYQLSYFDFNNSPPIKETPFDILNEEGKTCFTGGFLFHFPTKFEYEMLNLHTKKWLYGKNNLQLLEPQNSVLMYFSIQRSLQVPYNIDHEFNLIAINKTTKKLFLIPLKTPQTLYDIAWITALNAGLLNEIAESKLPKNLKYKKLF